MNCAICMEKEPEYEYRLMNGIYIPICKECGEILYGKNIGGEQSDHLWQMIMMIEYVRLSKEKQFVKTKQLLRKVG